MLSKRKSFLAKKTKDLKIKFSDFRSGLLTNLEDDVLPFSYAKLAYNYLYKDGALKTGYGFDYISLPKGEQLTEEIIFTNFKSTNGIERIWQFNYHNDKRNDSMMFYTDGRVKFFKFYLPSPLIVESASLSFKTCPNAVNYFINNKNAMVFMPTCEDDKMIVMSPSGVVPVKNPELPMINSLCNHYERLFATRFGYSKQLIFSSDLDPTNWTESATEGGHITFTDERGYLQRIISFNDYVYVIRDYGITRLSVYGDQSSFAVSHCVLSSSYIYGNSVTVCDDKVVYLARDGIHFFTGANETKVNLGIESMMEGVYNDGCVGVCFNGNYYLALRLCFDDNEIVGSESEAGYVNNALIELDLETRKINITRGVDIKDLQPLEDRRLSKLLACFRGKYKTTLGELKNNGKIFGEALTKVWKSPKSHLGYPGILKKIKFFTIITKSDLTVVFETDKEKKEINLRGSEKAQKVVVGLYGESIQVTFITKGDISPDVRGAEFVIGVI